MGSGTAGAGWASSSWSFAFPACGGGILQAEQECDGEAHRLLQEHFHCGAGAVLAAVHVQADPSCTFAGLFTTSCSEQAELRGFPRASPVLYLERQGHALSVGQRITTMHTKP